MSTPNHRSILRKKKVPVEVLCCRTKNDDDNTNICQLCWERSWVSLLLCPNPASAFSIQGLLAHPTEVMVDKASILTQVQIIIVELILPYCNNFFTSAVTTVEAGIRLTEAYNDLCRTDFICYQWE